jgi:multidrug transporter EmrE-like cation transporter
MLILGSVALSAFAQIFLKTGMSSESIQRALDQSVTFSTVHVIATNPWVIGGLVLYFLSAALWLLVLAKFDVSYAYPFVGLGFIFTLVLGWWLLQEPVDFGRMVGTLFVAVGVYLVGRS